MWLFKDSAGRTATSFEVPHDLPPNLAGLRINVQTGGMTVCYTNPCFTGPRLCKELKNWNHDEGVH